MRQPGVLRGAAGGCVECGRVSVLGLVGLRRCSHCGSPLCRPCWTSSTSSSTSTTSSSSSSSSATLCSHCSHLRSLGWSGCPWLVRQLTANYRLMEPARLEGRRQVSGLTGLVRQHCETVMASMVGGLLDTVDTRLREDWVSQAIYSRYQPRLADSLAAFTASLTGLLGGDSSSQADNPSNCHMELRHLVTSITENIIDANFRKVFCNIKVLSTMVI